MIQQILRIPVEQAPKLKELNVKIRRINADKDKPADIIVLYSGFHDDIPVGRIDLSTAAADVFEVRISEPQADWWRKAAGEWHLRIKATTLHKGSPTNEDLAFESIEPMFGE